MSIKNVEKFLNLAKTDEDLKTKLVDVSRSLQKNGGKIPNEEKFIKDKIVPLARKKGVLFTAKDFLKYADKQMSALSEEDLLNVSGGLSTRNTAAALLITFLGSLGVGAAVNLSKLTQDDQVSISAKKGNSDNGERLSHENPDEDEIKTESNGVIPKIPGLGGKVETEKNDNAEIKKETQPALGENNTEGNAVETKQENTTAQENLRKVMQNKNVVLPNTNINQAAPQGANSVSHTPEINLSGRSTKQAETPMAGGIPDMQSETLGENNSISAESRKNNSIPESGTNNSSLNSTVDSFASISGSRFGGASSKFSPDSKMTRSQSLIDVKKEFNSSSSFGKPSSDTNSRNKRGTFDSSSSILDFSSSTNRNRSQSFDELNKSADLTDSLNVSSNQIHNAKILNISTESLTNSTNNFGGLTGSLNGSTNSLDASSRSVVAPVETSLNSTGMGLQQTNVFSGNCGADEDEANVKYTFDKETGTLTISGNGQMKDYDDWDSEYVAFVPWRDFRNDIKKVIIEDKVTSIGIGAFSNCSSLTEVTIPNSVVSINLGAFLNCSNLTTITIPNSVTSIGEGAFSGCSNLTTITIPGSVTSIENFAFQFCSGLTSITIPDSVTSIGFGAFGQCNSLEEIKIPTSVEFIGEEAFMDCKNLTKVEIPNSVKLIKANAFFECKNLKNVKFDGTKEPECENDVFLDCPDDLVINVPANYDGDTFCGRLVTKSDAVEPSQSPLEAFKKLGFKSGNDVYESFGVENGAYFNVELANHILESLDNFDNLTPESQREIMMDTAALFSSVENKEENVYELGRMFDDDDKEENISEVDRMFDENDNNISQNDIQKLEDFYFKKVEPNYETIIMPRNDYEDLISINNKPLKIQNLIGFLDYYISKFDNLDPKSKNLLLHYIDDFLYKFYNEKTNKIEVPLDEDDGGYTERILGEMLNIAKENIFNQGEDAPEYKFTIKDAVKAAAIGVVLVGAVLGAAYIIGGSPALSGIGFWGDADIGKAKKKLKNGVQNSATGIANRLKSMVSAGNDWFKNLTNRNSTAAPNVSNIPVPMGDTNSTALVDAGNPVTDNPLSANLTTIDQNTNDKMTIGVLENNGGVAERVPTSYSILNNPQGELIPGDEAITSQSNIPRGNSPVDDEFLKIDKTKDSTAGEMQLQNGANVEITPNKFNPPANNSGEMQAAKPVPPPTPSLNDFNRNASTSSNKETNLKDQKSTALWDNFSEDGDHFPSALPDPNKTPEKRTVEFLKAANITNPERETTFNTNTNTSTSSNEGWFSRGWKGFKNWFNSNSDASTQQAKAPEVFNNVPTGEQTTNTTPIERTAGNVSFTNTAQPFEENGTINATPDGFFENRKTDLPQNYGNQTQTFGPMPNLESRQNKVPDQTPRPAPNPMPTPENNFETNGVQRDTDNWTEPWSEDNYMKRVNADGSEIVKKEFVPTSNEGLLSKIWDFIASPFRTTDIKSRPPENQKPIYYNKIESPHVNANQNNNNDDEEEKKKNQNKTDTSQNLSNESNQENTDTTDESKK